MTENPSKDKGFDLANSFPGLSGLDLAKEVLLVEIILERRCMEKKIYKYKVVSLDFGVKKNILRILIIEAVKLKLFR